MNNTNKQTLLREIKPLEPIAVKFIDVLQQNYPSCYFIVNSRTPSWNYMNNTNKQTLLREMKPLEPIAVKFIDVLQQKRLQTLQSVDSLVEKVRKQMSRDI